MMPRCQDASGWYLENTGNTALRDNLQGGIASSEVMAGTDMSNPLKTFSGIEDFKLRGSRVQGSYVVSGVEIRQNARFIALEGIGTFSVLFRKAFIANGVMLADPLGDIVKRIKPGMILLQTGMGLGVIGACIGLMRDSNRTHQATNQYLPRRVSYHQEILAEFQDGIDVLATIPTETAPDYMRRVLAARLHTSEMSLDAAQSALLHAVSRGFPKGSPVSRRLRESCFVAIITPRSVISARS